MHTNKSGHGSVGSTYRSMAFLALVLAMVASLLIASEPASAVGPIACGDPAATEDDQGVFLWKDCDSGIWSVRVAANDTAPFHPWMEFTGTLTSSQGFDVLTAVDINPDFGDYVRPDGPAKANFLFNLSANTGTEGLDFAVPIDSSLCFEVRTRLAPAPLAVFVGGERASAPRDEPFNPETLGGCGADDEPPVRPRLSIADATASETDGVAVATVSLSAPATSPVLVDIHTSSRTATGGGVDFRGFFKTLEVNPGQITIDVPVTLIEDGLDEGDETFVLMLTSPRGAVIADRTATVTIKDPDPDEPDNGLLVTDFGAQCDERTDDTVAIQAVLDRAQSERTGVIFPDDQVCLVHRVDVRNGVTFLTGGKVRFLPSLSRPNSRVGIVLQGRHAGQDDNVNDLLISDISLDLDGLPGDGIFGDNPSRVTVENIEVVGFTAQSPTAGSGYGVRFVAWDDGGEDMIGNVIRNSTFVGIPNAGEAIAMRAQAPEILDGFPNEGQDSYWQLNKQVPDSMFHAVDTVIVDNDIDGGSYGIVTTYGLRTLIEGNTVRNNTRNIALQKNSRHSTVRDNDLFNPISASIHIAQGSSDNLIVDNRIDTDVSHGDSLINIYIGAKRNEVRNNTITARPSQNGPFAPSYHLYAAVHADGNVFEDNTMSGVAAFSFIGVETGWDPTITSDIRHRGSAAGDRVGNYSDESMQGIRIVRNTITPADGLRSQVAMIVVTEVQERAGQLRLLNSTIEDNTVVGQPDYCIETIIDEHRPDPDLPDPQDLDDQIRDPFSTYDQDFDGVVDACSIG